MNKAPKTAKDALALWDAGEPVPAFRVEAEDSEQEAIYAVAFELIRNGQDQLPTPDNTLVSLTDRRESFTAAQLELFNSLSVREFHVAHSIAFVALKNGWAATLRQHIGEHIPAITVQKPKDATTPAHA
jgi:hypothetical protein